METIVHHNRDFIFLLVVAMDDAFQKVIHETRIVNGDVFVRDNPRVERRRRRRIGLVVILVVVVVVQKDGTAARCGKMNSRKDSLTSPTVQQLDGPDPRCRREWLRPDVGQDQKASQGGKFVPASRSWS